MAYSLYDNVSYLKTNDVYYSIMGLSADRKIPVSLRVPKSVDDFFERISTKSITIEGVEGSVLLRKHKSDMYLQALEYALEHAEDWLRHKVKGK